MYLLKGTEYWPLTWYLKRRQNIRKKIKPNFYFYNTNKIHILINTNISQLAVSSFGFFHLYTTIKKKPTIKKVLEVFIDLYTKHKQFYHTHHTNNFLTIYHQFFFSKSIWLIQSIFMTYKILFSRFLSNSRLQILVVHVVMAKIFRFSKRFKRSIF